MEPNLLVVYRDGEKVGVFRGQITPAKPTGTPGVSEPMSMRGDIMLMGDFDLRELRHKRIPFDLVNEASGDRYEAAWIVSTQETYHQKDTCCLFGVRLLVSDHQPRSPLSGGRVLITVTHLPDPGKGQMHSMCYLAEEATINENRPVDTVVSPDGSTQLVPRDDLHTLTITARGLQ